MAFRCSWKRYSADNTIEKCFFTWVCSIMKVKKKWLHNFRKKWALICLLHEWSLKGKGFTFTLWFYWRLQKVCLFVGTYRAKRCVLDQKTPSILLFLTGNACLFYSRILFIYFHASFESKYASMCPSPDILSLKLLVHFLPCFPFFLLYFNLGHICTRTHARID